MKDDKSRRLIDFLSKIKGGLIVSCQSSPGDPFYGPKFLQEFAKAAERAHAVCIRASGPRNICAIIRTVKLPIIGIYKKEYQGSEVYITPTSRELTAISKLGIDAVAIDFTSRSRPRGETLEMLMNLAIRKLKAIIVADVSTLEDAKRANHLGADIVATTLSGYTKETKHKLLCGVDLELIKQIRKSIDIPVIAEGRIWSSEDACAAIRAGAHAVVVGSAITRPVLIAERFVQALTKCRTNCGSSNVLGKMSSEES